MNRRSLHSRVLASFAWLLPVATLANCHQYRPLVMALSVSPAQLTFSTMSPTPAVFQSVQVTNVGDIAVAVTAVTMDLPNDLTVPGPDLFATDCSGNPRAGSHESLGVGECAQFSVQYTPSDPESVMNTVIIATNVPGQSHLQVPVTAANTWPPPICPNPPVAVITAATASGPLASAGSTVPGDIDFTSASSKTFAGATIVGSEWSLVTAPMASASSFEPSGADATISAQTAGPYEVGLSVIDSNGCTSQPVTFPFTVTIPPCFNVETPPTAVIIATVGTLPLPVGGILQNTTVSLDGSQSEEGTNPISRYSWSLVSAPVGNASNVKANGSSASIDCTQPGAYVVKLVVTDSSSCASTAALLDIEVTATPLQCGPASEFVYVIDEDGVMYQFDPTAVSFQQLGAVVCPGQTDQTAVGTMAVDRSGIAWVEYFDTGSVYRVDPSTLNCFPSGFNPADSQSPYWGSAYTNIPGTTDSQTYYIQEDGELASIDTTTMALTIVGTLGSGAVNEGELSGTPGGSLYGFFRSSANTASPSWSVSQIDRTSAAILSTIQLPIIQQTVPSPGGWAFAAWGPDFWFFVDNGGSQTDVFHFDASTGNTTLATQLTAGLDGAGVSPCVQIQ